MKKNPAQVPSVQYVLVYGNCLLWFRNAPLRAYEEDVGASQISRGVLAVPSVLAERRRDLASACAEISAARPSKGLERPHEIETLRRDAVEKQRVGFGS